MAVFINLSTTIYILIASLSRTWLEVGSPRAIVHIFTWQVRDWQAVVPFRMYFHSETTLPIVTTEKDQDSEDETIPEWMRVKTIQVNFFKWSEMRCAAIFAMFKVGGTN